MAKVKGIRQSIIACDGQSSRFRVAAFWHAPAAKEVPDFQAKLCKALPCARANCSGFPSSSGPPQRDVQRFLVVGKSDSSLLCLSSNCLKSSASFGFLDEREDSKKFRANKARRVPRRRTSRNAATGATIAGVECFSYYFVKSTNLLIPAYC